MPDLTLFLAHASKAVGALFAAAAPPGVRVVPFTSPHPGLSSAYDALARELRGADGRLLPALRRWVAKRTGQAVDGPIVAAWFSSGYALGRALAQHPADREEIAGWVAIDGGHAGLDKDGTASDSGIAWAVALAKAAAGGGAPCWYGHSDVRTAGYASTTQFAAELRRLAGEPRGHWHCGAFDVATAGRDEHIKAATSWGPTFAARACAEILGSVQPDTMPMIRARHFTDASRAAVDLVVIHSTESGRGNGAARAVATWFAGSAAPKASAHYVVDNDECIACVAEDDVAWAAPGGNRTGIQIELCGRASQTSEEWLSGAMLGRAAALVADICRRYQIPIERLGPADLLAGKRGITGHVDVSRAWKKSSHWDPGQSFPWAEFIEMVRRA